MSTTTTAFEDIDAEAGPAPDDGPEKPARALRAAIYTRISRDAEQQGLGVKRQEEDCRKLAKRAGYQVVRVFKGDNDISASTRSKKVRKDYDTMLAMARSGQIDVIVAYSNSRLTRRPAEWLELIDLANNHGTQIATVSSGQYDLGTADGRALAITVAAWDAAEAERTAERVARAHQQRAESGHYNGPRPFGYDLVGTGSEQELVVNEAEAAIVVECVDRVLAGETFWKLTNELNARGSRTTMGNEWKSQVLRRMLMRWTNCGMRSHRPLDKHGKRVGKDKELLVKAKWEPLYPREKHERLLEMLSNPKRKSNNRGTAPVYLLTSVAHCGECGGYVVGAKEYTYKVKGYKRKGEAEAPIKTRVYAAQYRCPNAGCMKVSRSMADVDAHVEEVVLGVLEREGVRLLGGDSVVVQQASERIAAIESQLALAIDRLVEGRWTDEQVDRLNARLVPELEAEKRRRAAALPASGMDGYVGQGAREAWARADVERKKTIIRTLGMRITIHRIGPGNGGYYDSDKVTIEWARHGSALPQHWT